MRQKLGDLAAVHGAVLVVDDATAVRGHYVGTFGHIDHTAAAQRDHQVDVTRPAEGVRDGFN